jgi:hypothetical protein
MIVLYNPTLENPKKCFANDLLLLSIFRFYVFNKCFILKLIFKTINIKVCRILCMSIYMRLLLILFYKYL